MEELVSFIERTPKAKHASHWKNYLRLLPSPLNEAKAVKTWQPAYNTKAISESLSHVQIVAYNEKIVSVEDFMMEIRPFFFVGDSKNDLHITLCVK